MSRSFNASRLMPYSHDELNCLVQPKSVAVIGASETAGSFGANTLANIQANFAGRVHLINPKRKTVLGLPCYPDVSALPETVDLAVLIIPAAGVPAALVECADNGAGSAVIYSSGFAELGTPEAIAAQSEIERIARERGIRVLGPNCIGLANIGLGFGATFMPSLRELPLTEGPIGIVSQSGALGYMLLQAMRRGVGFSHWLTTGNACDVDVADFVNYLVDEPACRAIACSFEGLASPDRFLAAARRALQAGKPLVALKVGRTEASRDAALSHTGSLVGSAAAYRAALESVGAIVVEDFEALIETAGFMAKAKPPQAAGTAVITMSGGAGIMALDLAEDVGAAMPQPSEATKARIRNAIPAFGSAANPTDLTGESIRFPGMYAETLRAFADDPAFGAIVVIMASGGYGQLATGRAEMIAAAARDTDKPVAVVWLNEWLEGPGSEVYDASLDLSSFRSLRRCLTTIAAWNRYYARRPALLSRASRAVSPRVSLRGVPDGRPRAISERLSKVELSNFDVPVTREALAHSADEAVSIAQVIGYPVVLKAESADIPHKSDVGVVRLKLKDDDAVRQAFADIQAVIDRLPGRPKVEGILVGEMIEAGVEVIVGSRYDDQFGPLISCGMGGVAVEVLRDVAVALAPVEPDEAREMIRSLKSYRLLTGFRGAPAMDVDAFAEIISRVSHFAWARGATVAEIDVNPVVLRPEGGVAVDALIISVEPETDVRATGRTAEES